MLAAYFYVRFFGTLARNDSAVYKDIDHGC